MSESKVDSVELAKSSLQNLVPLFGVIEVRGRTELTQNEINEILFEGDAAKQALKTVKETVEARVDEIRETVFNIADERVGVDEGYALYSPEHGLKGTREMRESSGGIDQNTLLQELYARFEEEPGDKTGKAWEMFKRVSDEVEAPRVLNAGKLEAELAKSIRVASGAKKNGGLTLPIDAVNAAKISPKKTGSFYIRKMTKDEMKAYEAGELPTGATEVE